MNHRLVRSGLAEVRRCFVQRWWVLLASLLALLAVGAPGCNLFNDLGNAWASYEMRNQCAGMGGGGGAGGGAGGNAGGDPGVGGADVGSSSTDVGVGGSNVASAAAGVGGSDVASAAAAGVGGSGMGSPVPHPGHGQARRALPARRRHRVRSGIGTAYQADCTPPDVDPPPPVPVWAPKMPMVVALTTTRLRAIAAAQGIGAGQTGIQLNRTIGLAFENWVLFMRNQLQQRWTTPIPSPRRKQKTGGLPASVIPEFVSDLNLVYWGSMTPVPFPESEFWEVKAVTGALTLSTSKYQILGLIDVASMSPAGLSTVAKHPPPVVRFTITGNTSVSQGVLAEATQDGVAIWAEVVFEAAITPNDPDPDLYIGQLVPMNPDVYGTAVPVPSQPSGAHSKLMSPTTPPVAVPGDPDPPEVD